MYTFLAKIQSGALLAGGGDFRPRDTSEDEASFTESGLWKLISAILFLLGAVLGVFGIVKFVGKIGGGKVGEAAKTLVATIFGCAFLFNPEWIFGIFDIAGNLMGSVLDSVGGATENNNAPSAPR